MSDNQEPMRVRTLIDEEHKVICWFCEKHLSDTGKQAELTLKRDHKYTKAGNATLQTWKENKIRVPRCASCLAEHVRVDYWARVGSLLTISVGLAAIQFTVGLEVAWGFISNTSVRNESLLLFWAFVVVLMFGLAIIGNFIGKRVGEKTLPADVRSESDKKTYPAAVAARLEGWK